VRCAPDNENADLFHAAIGGFGMLGVFTSITLRLRRVASGLLRVTPYAARNWDEMYSLFAGRAADADYIVGWVDGFAGGEAAGRGLVHTAHYLPPGEDSRPAQTLRVASQDLGDSILGVVPKSILWRFMKPMMNAAGIGLLNRAQYAAGRFKAGTAHYETHAGFAFMLDYVPDWKRAYGGGGLLQHQSFVPAQNARAVYADVLDHCRRADLVPTLCVFKQHRADAFLMSYALDGFSMALDFKRTAENDRRLSTLFAELDRLIIDGGGRFYFAKDSLLQPSRLASFFAEPRVQRFLQWKKQIDPGNLLQTDLYRRILGQNA
jgi:FAD/FMN-containing dehydrogenase